MTEKGRAVLRLLTEEQIPFTVYEHEPVYTIEEMLQVGLPDPDAIAKNLFVRDDKKRNYYLLVIREDKNADLRRIQQAIGSRRLSFASESDLQAILGLERGGVTPFGALNDAEHRVHIYLDESFFGGRIGVHPNENIATVFLSADDLAVLLRRHGAAVDPIRVQEEEK